MITKLRRWAQYAKASGTTNASMYALYRIFPHFFTLVTEFSRQNPASSANLPDYFSNMFDRVFDFVSWENFGGSNIPGEHQADNECLIWFVPDWANVWGGGHYTLFRFANYFASRGTHNLIYVFNNQRHSSPALLQRDLERALRPCRVEVVVDPKRLPRCAAAFATTWQSTYHVRAFPFAQKKLYFMQDYECNFYPFGTAALQAIATYGFGFEGITGGGWLKSRYEAHGGHAIEYRFAADRDIFYPRNSSGAVNRRLERIFFYGRPSTERRCFELGMTSLKMISERFPEIEIVIAGLDLQSRPPFKATLMGNMALADTGKLYRDCDAGLAFSATNLSYLPVELMASGVPVLSNRGPQVEWHCRHGENAYLVDPTPTAVLNAFAKLYEFAELRQHLVDGGLCTMSMLRWEDEMDRVFNRIFLSGTNEECQAVSAVFQH